MNLSERIKAARQYAGLTQAKLAKRVGVAQTAISQLESGKVQRTSYLSEIAYACAVNSQWLASGRGVMVEVDGAAQVDMSKPRLDLQSTLVRDLIGSMSPIAVNGPEVPEDIAYIPALIETNPSDSPELAQRRQASKYTFRFSKRALADLNIDHQKVYCVAVTGNAMAPVLRNGSVIAVDTDRTEITDGLLYVLRHFGQLRVRYLYRIPGGGIRIRSLNHDEHPDESYSAEDVVKNSIEVIGRAFWGASFF